MTWAEELFIGAVGVLKVFWLFLVVLVMQNSSHTWQLNRMLLSTKSVIIIPSYFFVRCSVRSDQILISRFFVGHMSRRGRYVFGHCQWWNLGHNDEWLGRQIRSCKYVSKPCWFTLRYWNIFSFPQLFDEWRCLMFWLRCKIVKKSLQVGKRVVASVLLLWCYAYPVL